jgi:hypothetical protein
MDKCVYVCVYGYEKLVVVKRTNDQGNLITNLNKKSGSEK